MNDLTGDERSKKIRSVIKYVVDKIMSLKVVILRTCENVTLWEKGFADVRQLRILRWKIILHYLDRLNVISRVLQERGKRVRVR